MAQNDFALGLDHTQRLNKERMAEAASYFESARGSTSERLEAFPRFVDRSSVGRLLVRYELFKLALSVHGSVIECGVFDGFGVFAFAQMSVLLEPLNHRRRVIGFDSFSGFPSVSPQDTSTGFGGAVPGAWHGATLEELMHGVRIFDLDRPLKQIPKIHFVAGDFLEVCSAFVSANPHLVVALLYMDFDLFEPTAKALELFLPLMPRGAVVAFDQVHVAEFPGETQALLTQVGIREVRLQRFPFSSICYAVLE